MHSERRRGGWVMGGRKKTVGDFLLLFDGLCRAEGGCVEFRRLTVTRKPTAAGSEHRRNRHW